METQQKQKARRITRSVSLRNGRGNSLPIPIDIIILIFSNLDSKSIARCRCVSKLWAAVLRRSDFTDLFLRISSSRRPKLLLVHQRMGKLSFFSAPQPQNPDENSSPIVPNYRMKFSFFSDREMYSYQMDLVHGLICLNYLTILNKRLKIRLKICNPSTGQVLVLPKVTANRNRVWSSLGYDPIAKQFKILSITHSERFAVACEKYQVLSLGTESMSWRMIGCDIPHYFPDKKICINGVLYYTSIDPSTEICIVVCFDVRFEKFNSIKIMGTMNEAVLHGRYDMINYNGKLSLLYVSENGLVSSAGKSLKFKLWVLEDHEEQKWSKHTLVFSTMPDNIVGEVFLSFVGVTKKREIVLSSNDPPYLYYLNLEKKNIVRIEIQGIDNRIDHIFLDHVEDVKLY